VATTMRGTYHRGWQIEARSYQADSNRWCPRALVSRLDGGRFCPHDVRALLSVTFDTARSADDYAVQMAKKWIDDRDYRPLGRSATLGITAFATPPRSSRDGSGTAPSGA
jgi:hypothetical protein